MTKATVAHFGDDLTLSHDPSNEPVWAEYYHRMFPGLAATVKIDNDCVMQRNGIDRILVFGSGMQLTVDEKQRSGKWKDILLEEWSSKEAQIPGWTIDEKKLCDYIAYAIPELARCFFIPYPLLRETFRHNLDSWRVAKDYKGRPALKRVPNQCNGQKWMTINVAVTWEVLKDAIFQQMFRGYAGELSLPTPTVIGENEYQVDVVYDSASTIEEKWFGV